MIKIEHVPPNTSDWKGWLKRCQAAREKAIQDYEKNGSIEIDSGLYSEMKNRYFLNVDGPFRGKCAYCEQQIARDQYGDIDHYRPKKGVTDENDRVINITVNGEERSHPGYYWLAYEWTNMLPSCQFCNRPFSGRTGDETLGKRNRFPVVSGHAIEPGEEKQEEPLLINPTVDDPAEHFSCDNTGVLILLTEKAKVTDKILALNDRSLAEQRQNVYQANTAKAMIAIINIVQGGNYQNEISELKKSYSGSTAFTIAARAAINEVDIRVDGLLRRRIQNTH